MHQLPLTITAQDFALYAGADIARWQTLAGTTVTHLDIGEARIEKVTGAAVDGAQLRVTYKRGSGKQETMRYPLAKFYEIGYFKAVTFPPALVALVVEERERTRREVEEGERKAAEAAERAAIEESDRKAAVAAEYYRQQAIVATWKEAEKEARKAEARALEPAAAGRAPGAVGGGGGGLA